MIQKGQDSAYKLVEKVNKNLKGNIWAGVLKSGGTWEKLPKKKQHLMHCMGSSSEKAAV